MTPNKPKKIRDKGFKEKPKNNHKLRLELRREQVITMHLQGYGYRHIAAQLKISLSTVNKDMTALLKRIAKTNDEKTQQFKEIRILQYAQTVAMLAPFRMVEARDAEGNILKGKDGKTPVFTPNIGVFDEIRKTWADDNKVKCLGDKKEITADPTGIALLILQSRLKMDDVVLNGTSHK